MMDRIGTLTVPVYNRRLGIGGDSDDFHKYNNYNVDAKAIGLRSSKIF